MATFENVKNKYSLSLKKRLSEGLMFYPISFFFSWLLEKFTKKYKKVIYVSSTGRSGTDGLSKLFSVIPDVYSTHEPIPIMNNNEMIEFNNGNSSIMKKKYNLVKKNMLRLGQLKNKKYYLESNHMFIKCFIDEVVKDCKENLIIIHLYRNPVKVAKSLLDLDMVPGTEKSNKWYLDYKAKKNLIKIDEILDNNISFSDNYYKCLWYWYEIEARTFYYRIKYKNIKFYDFRTEDLNDFDKVENLINKLDIDFDDEKLKNIIGIKHNLKSKNKKSTISFEDAEKMHENFKKLLIDYGFIEESFDDSGIPKFKEKIFNEKT